MQYVPFIQVMMYYTALVEALLLLSLVLFRCITPTIEWDTCQDRKNKSS